MRPYREAIPNIDARTDRQTDRPTDRWIDRRIYGHRAISPHYLHEFSDGTRSHTNDSCCDDVRSTTSADHSHDLPTFTPINSSCQSDARASTDYRARAVGARAALRAHSPLYHPLCAVSTLTLSLSLSHSLSNSPFCRFSNAFSVANSRTSSSLCPFRFSATYTSESR
jgi:hypothetical protein